MRIVIKPRALVDGTGAPPLEQPAVLVEDGRIAWVGRAADLAAEVAGAETLAAPDQTLLPGLIDAHVHLTCSGESTVQQMQQAYEQRSDDRLLPLAVGNAQAGLAAGITTMRDLGARGFGVLALRDAIDAGQLVGPRLLAAGPCLTKTGGHFHYAGVAADNSEQLASAARTLCEAGVDVLKVMGSGGAATQGTDPRRPQYTAAQLRAVVEEGQPWARPLAVHAHGVAAIQAAVEAGVRTVEHCTWLGANGIELHEATAAAMADRGIFVSLGMSARFRLPGEVPVLLRVPGRSVESQRELLFAAISRMRALGVKVVPSSDAGTPLTYISDLALLLQAMVEQVGMGELEAIQSVTGTAAEALGIADEVGTITKGLLADLVLVEGDPRRDILSLRRVDRVFREGRLVAVGGGFLKAN